MADPFDQWPRSSMFTVVNSLIVNSPPLYPSNVRPMQPLASSSSLPTVVSSTGSKDSSSYAPRQLCGSPIPGRMTVSGGRASSLSISSPSVMFVVVVASWPGYLMPEIPRTRRVTSVCVHARHTDQRFARPQPFTVRRNAMNDRTTNKQTVK